MISSMTGFGKGVNETENGSYTVEIKTVNNRYTDITVRGPRDFLVFEEKVKKYIQSNLKRGKVDVFINFKASENSGRVVKFDENLANEYFKALRRASEVCGVPFNGQAGDLFRMPEVFTTERVEREEDEVWNELLVAVEAAVSALCAMRKREGENLKIVLENILENMESLFETVIVRARALPSEYASKLQARITELMPKDCEPDAQRLATEIAVFADHCNVDEEIARFGSHVQQMREMLASDEPVGRKMDFLVQELNREVNTIGSKSADSDITNTVIELKSEIEKIREQIQNIE